MPRSRVPYSCTCVGLEIAFLSHRDRVPNIGETSTTGRDTKGPPLKREIQEFCTTGPELLVLNWEFGTENI